MKKFLIAVAMLAFFGTLANAQPMPPPYHDGYYYRHGLHNDRYPADRYYWHAGEGRYYQRYYLASHRYVRCNDGVIRRARPGACRYNGGVLYFY